MLPSNRDTICALATARGRAGIAVVRLSGPDALAIGWSRFAPHRSMDEPPPRQMVLGRVLDATGETLDEALCVYFPAGGSYTGEPVVEWQLHGNPAIVEAALESLLAGGARLAEPGEFTRRAYLAGRMDLSQAEAVADLIEARSLAAARAAQRRLSGALSAKVTELRNVLIEAMALAEAEIDFPEEDIGEVDQARLRALVEQAQAGVAELLAGHQRARALAEGAQVAIAGRPNAGKSSLLNRLAGTRRALVHPEAGTTRDRVEVEVVIDGIPVRLIDTAGLRRHAGDVEQQGIELARQAVAEADHVIYLIDGGVGVTEADRELIAELPERRLIVWNKVDLRAPSTDFADLGDVTVSATEGTGIDTLRERLVVDLGVSEDASETLLATIRHKNLTEIASDRLQTASAATQNGVGIELVVTDLRDAATALGEILGETTADDVLDALFSRFCVGK